MIKALPDVLDLFPSGKLRRVQSVVCLQYLLPLLRPESAIKVTTEVFVRGLLCE